MTGEWTNMIIASGPYLSPHFIGTVADHGWPVVDAGGAAELAAGAGIGFVDPGHAAAAIRSDPEMRVLSSGEHALDWVGRNLAGTHQDRAALLFKDKAEFRRLMAPLFPRLRFRELTLDGLPAHVPAADDYPFVIKPLVGFFSIGVHIVRTPEEWARARSSIAAEVAAAEAVFPEHMLSRGRFLLESFIEGDEYAVDAYFDAEGRPVVLNVLEHRYAGPGDVSDRLYVSSRRIVESLAPPAGEFLAAINRRAGIRNFPLHAEFRRGADGALVPIEVNPLRFGGWCTTGDFAHFAWGFNSYELYMEGAAPDWGQAFAGRADREFGLVVLENDTGIAPRDLGRFDYEALLARFTRPLHLARMDYRRFPLFGFLFVETPDSDPGETDWVLRAKLREFLR